MKKTVGLIVGIVVALFLCIFLGAQGVKNRAYTLEEQVNTTQSDIKVQEKRRVDLIYNLVDCVKQYDKHEAQTLEAVVKARENNSDDSAVVHATNEISAVAEAYPDLKANQNYKTLMNELSTTENLIAQNRSTYNDSVKEYRRYIRKFPNNIFLSVTNYNKQDYKYLNYDVSEDAPQNLFGEND